MSSAGHVVVDTGVLIAAADADDRWHEQAADLLTSRRGDELVLPAPVATEAAWMISSRLGATTEAAFVGSIAAGDLTLVDLVSEDWSRCADLIVTYSDLNLGLVDASVIAIAERLVLSTLATIDHRHFRIVRPRHCAAFELIP